MEELDNKEDNYEIIKQITVGGFGSIYKAYDKKNKRDCALKKIQKELIDKTNIKDYQLELIKREIKIMQSCKSTNIVEFYDSFETKDSFAIVMELCDYNLEQYIHEKQDKGELLELSFIKKFFNDLNNAIKTIYQNKIIHRDLKPSNIFIKNEGGNLIPKLGDFGVSTFQQIDKTLHEQIGTVYYMAPEILKGDMYNYKCDLYSLGCILYKMVFLSDYYIDHIIDGEDKISKLSKEKGLDNLYHLLSSLLEKDPNKRISMEEYLNHPFFKEDQMELNQNENFKDNKIILKDEDNVLNKEKKKINNLVNFYAKEMLNIMDISNAKKDKSIKTANILYYDENIEKHLKEIHHDSDYFERNTPGTFILCSNILSLNLVLEEIFSYYSKKDSRCVFNLIVTGSKYKKVMDTIIKLEYEQLFQNICIYCMNIEAYSKLMKENKKIKGVYKDPKDIVKFIKEVSSSKIVELNVSKIITYLDYKNKYYERHEKISEFYGDMTKESYLKFSQKLEKYIKSKEESEFKIKKNKLIESLKIFDIKEDIKNLHQLMIHEYTKNTYYGPLNRWLKYFDEDAYEAVAYYTARLMYALNSRAKEMKSFYNKNNFIYRGESVKYINIAPFERLKGKIIVLSAFTSTSETLSIAEDFSKRKKSKEIFEKQKKFSVIYKIKNISKNNCISCGINIQDVSKYDEKEILYQPFTFYMVKNTNFNYSNYTVDIELEIIPKSKIFEEDIKKGKKIIYDEINNLMVIEDEQKYVSLENKKEKKSNCSII